LQTLFILVESLANKLIRRKSRFIFKLIYLGLFALDFLGLYAANKQN